MMIKIICTFFLEFTCMCIFEHYFISRPSDSTTKKGVRRVMFLFVLLFSGLYLYNDENKNQKKTVIQITKKTGNNKKIQSNKGFNNKQETKKTKKTINSEGNSSKRDDSLKSTQHKELSNRVDDENISQKNISQIDKISGTGLLKFNKSASDNIIRKLTPYQKKRLKQADLMLDVLFTKILRNPNLPKKTFLQDIIGDIEKNLISKVIFNFEGDSKKSLVLDFDNIPIKSIFTVIRKYTFSLKIRANSIKMLIEYKNGTNEEKDVF